jgi:uncharacterized protein YkwD
MKNLYIVLSILGVSAFAKAQTSNYQTAGSNSENTSSQSLNTDETAALQYHNEARREVGTPNLVWSKDLSLYAQQWADYLANNGCQFKHRGSGDRNGKNYGENIAYSSAGYSLLEGSKAWYSEIQKFQNVTLNGTNWYDTGHYTQMVWRNTKEVGMGLAKCSNGATIVVANYNPPGNYMGEKAY